MIVSSQREALIRPTVAQWGSRSSFRRFHRGTFYCAIKQSWIKQPIHSFIFHQYVYKKQRTIARPTANLKTFRLKQKLSVLSHIFIFSSIIMLFILSPWHLLHLCRFCEQDPFALLSTGFFLMQCKGHATEGAICCTAKVLILGWKN